MIDAAGVTACRAGEEHCITCGDEGIPMRVLALRGADAVCSDEESTRHQVAVDLVGPVEPGDEVLVHAGVAIRRLEEVPR
jgi:hydrogenase assembly chaperone HypC/HupF